MVAVDRDRVAAALPGYAVGPQLGAGGSGLVLAGRHRDLDRQVAIKVLATTTADPAVMDAYRTEARLLNRLDHPHIVRIHDFIARDDVCLLVMELLPGGPVDARRLTPPAACAVALAVAHALARSHQAGILHRDVKPANILFTARGQPKLTDFGIAKISEGAGGAASRLAGTPRYMAPEQIRRGRLGPATDIYGLGAVLHELLRGAPLFPADLPVPELFRRHVEVDPPPLPGVPEALAVVVQRALAKDPAARQPGGTVFAEELTAAADAAFGPGWLPGSGVTVVTTAFTSGTITPGTITPGTIDSGSTARGAAPVHVTDATRLAHPSHPTHAPHPSDPSQHPVDAPAPVDAAQAVDAPPAVRRSEVPRPAHLPQPTPGASPVPAPRHVPASGAGARAPAPPPAPGAFRPGGYAPGDPAVRPAELDAPTSAPDGERRRRRSRRRAAALAGTMAAVVAGILACLGGLDGGGTQPSPRPPVTSAADAADLTAPGPDGIATTGPFAALAVAGDGTVYLADRDNPRIIAVDPRGYLRTIAGGAESGSAGDGGPALRATLQRPQGLAVDAAGACYIFDGSNRVRRVDPRGIISTIAGGGTAVGSGGDGGPALRASLTAGGLDVDAAGNLYLSSLGVRRIDRTGMLTTLIDTTSDTRPRPLGDGGPASGGAVRSASAVAVDHAGTIYIADWQDNRIRRIDPRGIVTTVAGNGTKGLSGDGGPATAAQLNGPRGVAVDAAGTLYIADTYNRRIRRVGVDGIITTFAGSSTQDPTAWDGVPTHVSLWNPEQVAVGRAGDLYIGDSPRVLRIDPHGVGHLLAHSRS